MSMPSTRPVTPERRRPTPGGAAVVMGLAVALLWGLEIVDQSSGNSLDAYGIHPRTEQGLWEILTAPLLHFGWGHLLSNTVPFFVLGLLILVSGVKEWLVATAAAVLCSGLLVWLIAPDRSVTAGASGVVFGWLTYLLVRGFFTRRPGQILLAVVVFAFYGGVLLGALPGQAGVSWQGHLGGAIGGLLAAWMVARPSGAVR